MQKDLDKLKSDLRKLEPASQKRNQISAQESRLDKKRKDASLIELVKGLLTIFDANIPEDCKVKIMD